MKEWLTVITSSPGADAERQQGEMQRRRAVGYGAGMGRADQGRKFASKAATCGPCDTQPEQHGLARRLRPPRRRAAALRSGS